MPEEIQKATITARYNTGANVEVLRWHSADGDPKFHESAVNETVTIPLQNPAGAASVTLDFRLFDATNNWWWAIDNINVFTGAAPASDAVLRAIIDRNTKQCEDRQQHGRGGQSARLFAAVRRGRVQRTERRLPGRQ